MLVWVLVGVEVEAEVGCLVVVGAHLVADTAVPAAVDKVVHPAVEKLAVVVHARHLSSGVGCARWRGHFRSIFGPVGIDRAKIGVP